MTGVAGERAVLWSPLVAATLALPWIVPELPLGHLDDPSYWGVLGFALFLGVMLVRAAKGHDDVPRALLALLLAAMPVVYVANWARFGGDRAWLAIELAGLLLFGAMTLLGWRGAKGWLILGVAGHAVWDAAHIGRVSFVPDWYAIGCAVVDIAVAGFAAAGYLVWVSSDRRS